MTLAEHLAGPVEPWRLELISAHSRSVERFAAALQRRHPRHDVEPAAFTALYLAALTWNPDGTAGFHHWVRSKVIGAMSRFRRQSANRERGLMPPGKGGRRCAPIRITSLEAGHVDDRLCYRDPPPGEAPATMPGATVRREGRRVMVTYRGERHDLKDWSEILGVPYGVLHYRHRRGWDAARILTTPVRGR